MSTQSCPNALNFTSQFGEVFGTMQSIIFNTLVANGGNDEMEDAAIDNFMVKMTTIVRTTLEKMGSVDKEIFKMLLPYTGFYELSDLMEKIADNEEHLVDRATVTEIFGGGRKRKRNSKKKKNKIRKKSRKQRGGAAGKCLEVCHPASDVADCGEGVDKFGHNCGTCQQYTGKPGDYQATIIPGGDTAEFNNTHIAGNYYCLPKRQAARNQQDALARTQLSQAQLLEGLGQTDRAALANTMLAGGITLGFKSQQYGHLVEQLAGMSSRAEKAKKILLAAQRDAATKMDAMREEGVAKEKKFQKIWDEANALFERAGAALLQDQEQQLNQSKLAAQKQIQDLKTDMAARKSDEDTAWKRSCGAGGVIGVGAGGAVYWGAGLLGTIIKAAGGLFSGVFGFLGKIPYVGTPFAWVEDILVAIVDWAAENLTTAVGVLVAFPLAIVTAVCVAFFLYALWRRYHRHGTKAEDENVVKTAAKVATTPLGMMGFVWTIHDFLDDSEAYKKSVAFQQKRIQDGAQGQYYMTPTTKQIEDKVRIVMHKQPGGWLKSKEEPWVLRTLKEMADEAKAVAGTRHLPDIEEKRQALARALEGLAKATAALQKINDESRVLDATHQRELVEFDKNVAARMDKLRDSSNEHAQKMGLTLLDHAFANTGLSIADRSQGTQREGLFKRIFGWRTRGRRLVGDGGGGSTSGGADKTTAAPLVLKDKEKGGNRKLRRRKHNTHRKRKKCHRRRVRRTKYRQRKGRKSRRKRTKRRRKSRKRNSRS